MNVRCKCRSFRFECSSEDVINKVQNMRQWNKQTLNTRRNWKKKHLTLDRIDLFYIEHIHPIIAKAKEKSIAISFASISFCHQNKLENIRANSVDAYTAMALFKTF